MPKILDYPKSSFIQSLVMAEAIDSLGGNCDKESCAHQMGLKPSGAFNKRIGGAVKYELIITSKGRLSITDLYKSIKNAYNDDERNLIKKESFLKPPVYRTLYDTFKGKKLPVGILDKYLIREFGVDDRNASAVSNNFLKDMESIGLLVNDVVVDNDIEEIEEFEAEEETSQDLTPTKADYKPKYVDDTRASQILHIENKGQVGSLQKGTNEFIVHIIGPGMDSQLVIKEEEDLLIVNAMLQKVKKKL